MKEFQNLTLLRRRADEAKSDVAMIERKTNPSAGHWRNILGGFLFLLIHITILGGIVYHYSQFSFTSGKFILITEESGIVSGDQGDIEYERLLVRNRFPFVLTMTVRLCRNEGNAESLRFFVLEKRYYSFTGVRSLYSGTYETHINTVASGDGRFHVTDRAGVPQELLNMATYDADKSEQNLWLDETQLPKNFLEATSEDKLKYRGSYYWLLPLPGDYSDMFLLCTLTPQANYGR